MRHAAAMALRLGSYETVPGDSYRTPKEVWGFRTRPGRGTPLQIAREFLRANEALLGLAGIRGQLKRPRVIHSLGASHVILQQHHTGAPIHRAYVSVHIGHDRRVYLVKNRAVPRENLSELLADLPRKGEKGKKGKKGKAKRLRRADAVQSLRRYVRRIESNCRVRDAVERVWFPARTKLHLCFKIRLHVKRPREEWIGYVDAVTGKVVSAYDNLAEATARARVFDPNPVVALGDHRLLLDANGNPVEEIPRQAYRNVALRGLRALRRNGTLDGPRVTTRPTGRGRIRRKNGDFVFDHRENGFEEAMVYFHVDRAIRYLEALGYRGERAIFDAPLPVNVRGTDDDQSWYSPGQRQLFFGLGGGVNDAEDAETILHEFGHALQDAICPDFGQSRQAAAMGEGFGDYLALTFFADKRPARYRTCVMTWDGITWDENDPPCVRNLSTGASFESFDWETKDAEHANGLIWGETLWDIWNAVGKRTADRIIIESHFQLDGFTTFARGARAILDADRNLNAGKHVRRLTRIFRARGIGPV